MRRHVRHRLLPEIGDAGQARLEATRVAPPAGDPRAAAVLADYLARAGVSVGPGGAPVAAPSSEAVDALAGRASLREAAAFVAGAFAAVEVMKATLGVGRPGSLDGVTLAPEDAP